MTDRPLVVPVTEDVWERTVRYANKKSLAVDRQRQFGGGIDGCVWQASAIPSGETAVKVFDREGSYCRERESYRRLREHGVTEIREFHVPALVDYDDELWVVEMEVVSPPFILDFGQAYVDCLPPYADSNDLMAEFEANQAELFTESQWSQVKLLLYRLQRYGIYYTDPNPRNICGPYGMLATFRLLIGRGMDLRVMVNKPMSSSARCTA